MLSVFVCVSWPKMTAWHTWTAGNFGAGSAMAWRLCPTPVTYARFPPLFRPTQIQLLMPHPTVIDWLAWPELRNKLILYHSANPYLDDIIREIGNSYVVEADLSSLVAGIGSVAGYVGVWDLIRAISPEAVREDTEIYRDDSQEFEGGFYAGSCFRGPSSPEEVVVDIVDQALKLPAPSVNALFESKTLATQAFRLLKMDKVESLRLDPTFFDSHPELCDCRESLAARGIHLKPSSWISVPLPRPVEPDVLGIYNELTTQALRLSVC